MSILIDENTKVVVQGLTGREGQFHGLRNRDYGTKVVAGTRPGKGGEEIEGIPIFNSVKEAISATGANTSLVFVPPSFAGEAILEAADAGCDHQEPKVRPPAPCSSPSHPVRRAVCAALADAMGRRDRLRWRPVCCGEGARGQGPGHAAVCPRELGAL